ncbi:MAG: amidohydrolase family protein, partial [Opitutales bacterium]|nr:amidohydrolase family protein [Opitutales bacterium]
GARVHLQNITSGSAVDIIMRAKNRGVKVTAEVTPHHLSLTDACVAGYESRFKMNPPLRTEEDRRRLIEGLRSGVIDCIACDHAPHNEDDKDMEFDYAPFGVIGLETAFGVVLTHLHHEEGISLIQILEWMSSAPDRILGLAPKTVREGAPADFILFDPSEEWEVKKDGFLSISRNSPWIGQSLKGRVRATYLKGREVYGG